MDFLKKTDYHEHTEEGISFEQASQEQFVNILSDIFNHIEYLKAEKRTEELEEKYKLIDSIDSRKHSGYSAADYMKIGLVFFGRKYSTPLEKMIFENKVHEYLTKAEQMDQDDPQVKYHLGELHERLERHNKALEYYVDTIKKSTNTCPELKGAAYARIGFIASHILSSETECLRQFLHALTQDPKNPELHCEIGKLYEKQSEYDLALQYLRQSKLLYSKIGRYDHKIIDQLNIGIDQINKKNKYFNKLDTVLANFIKNLDGGDARADLISLLEGVSGLTLNFFYLEKYNDILEAFAHNKLSHFYFVNKQEVSGLYHQEKLLKILSTLMRFTNTDTEEYSRIMRDLELGSSIKHHFTKSFWFNGLIYKSIFYEVRAINTFHEVLNKYIELDRDHEFLKDLNEYLEDLCQIYDFPGRTNPSYLPYYSKLITFCKDIIDGNISGQHHVVQDAQVVGDTNESLNQDEI
ncbi:MAG: hypothetical protein SFT93_04590 [Rickettsiaceae bacterium]|nr:hypothetical protein [Rickettsiaceae bacterium]